MYGYTPLASPDDFRLVRLHQSSSSPSNDDALIIEFLPARFDERCSYIALSYAWGTDSGREDIQLKGTGGQILHVTRNLASALRSMQRSDHLILWIDALCIDQNNVQEKNHQVGRMAEIYRRASCVVIWLGEASNNSEVAMDFITNISTKDIDSFCSDPKNFKIWEALDALLKRSWFTRRWVVQEVSFARHAILR